MASFVPLQRKLSIIFMLLNLGGVRINNESKVDRVDRVNHMQGKDDHVVVGHAYDKVDDQVITGDKDCQGWLM